LIVAVPLLGIKHHFSILKKTVIELKKIPLRKENGAKDLPLFIDF